MAAEAGMDVDPGAPKQQSRRRDTGPRSGASLGLGGPSGVA